MTRNWFHSSILILFIALVTLGTFFASTSTVVLAQQPTDLPPAEAEMYITVITDEPQINIRMGPSSSIYPVVGTLLKGATAPALGRSAGGDWVQIKFEGAPNGVGWVYSPLVQVSPGTLKIIEPPPTPVQPAPPTIDPTLAAQFTIVPTSTRPSTFTPPPSLAVPTYTQVPIADPASSVPLAVIIIALAILGCIGFLPSLFVRR